MRLWSAIIRAAGVPCPRPANPDRLWHHEHMLQLARAIVGVASDVLRLIVSFLRLSWAIRAENLVLRKQLARYIERGIKPRRVDHATRVSLAGKLKKMQKETLAQLAKTAKPRRTTAPSRSGLVRL